MGTEATVLSIAIAATTVMVLLTGIIHLRRQSEQRLWKIYLGVVLTSTTAVLGAAITLWSAGDVPAGLSDEQEVGVALAMGIPFAGAIILLFVGLLLGLLGLTASRDRAAAANKH